MLAGDWRTEIPAIGFVVVERLAAMSTGMAARVIDFTFAALRIAIAAASADTVRRRDHRLPIHRTILPPLVMR